MRSKSLFITGSVLFAAIAVGIGLDVNHPLLKSHTDTLQKMSTVSLSFTVNRLGSELEDQKLVLSKPDLLRWETPSKLVVANGKTIAFYDKKGGTYTEEPQTRASLLALFNSDTIWAWSAIFDDAFAKPITDAKAGATRKIKGATVKELTVARGPRVTTLLMDDALGFARGVTFQSDAGGQKTTTIVTASDLSLGKEPLLANNAAFTLPAGAKKIEKSDIALTFQDVRPVLQANCNCHFNQPRGGLSMSSYANLMRGGRNGQAVAPGNPDGSYLIQVITGAKQPKMPPQGSVPRDQLETLKKWIADGAKE